VAVIRFPCDLRGGRIDDGTQAAPERLFFDFCPDEHVPQDHILRQVGRFLDLSEVRRELKPFYSHIGRPSIDPELMVRMLIVGYCLAIRSERRLCEEVHLNLAYRGRPLRP
jgi:transposase